MRKQNVRMSSPVKLKLAIAYDGAGYDGWQTQKTGVGVQQRVEEALGKIIRSAPRLHSSSRTDTGVHALGMVAHVEIPRAEFKMPVAKLALALNANLPEDIRVMQVRYAPAKFHARFDAGGKQYRYFVWAGRMMNPLLRQQAWHVPQKLDVKLMRAAANCASPYAIRASAWTPKNSKTSSASSTAQNAPSNPEKPVPESDSPSSNRS